MISSGLTAALFVDGLLPWLELLLPPFDSFDLVVDAKLAVCRLAAATLACR